MMVIKKLTALCFLFTGMFWHFGYSQSECDNALFNADKYYEQGEFQECIDILNPCVSHIKNREYRIQAYRLLALAHLNQNNQQKSAENIVKLLKLKPDYKKYPNVDPANFIKQLSEYKVIPVFSGGLKFGFNVNSVALKKSYSTFTSSQRYLATPGFQVGFSGKFKLKNEYGIYCNAMYAGMGVEHEIDNADGWLTKYSEQMNFINLDLAFVKNINLTPKINLYSGLGPCIGYLQSANAYLESKNLTTEQNQLASKNNIDEKHRLQYAAQLVLGSGVQIAQGTVSLEAGYSHYFRNTVKADKRLSDMNFVYNNQYISDDIQMRLFSVNVHYQIPLLWSVKH